MNFVVPINANLVRKVECWQRQRGAVDYLFFQINKKISTLQSHRSHFDPPGPPCVGSMCQRVEDCQQTIHWDDDHHKTRDVISKNPATMAKLLFVGTDFDQHVFQIEVGGKQKWSRVVGDKERECGKLKEIALVSLTSSFPLFWWG